MRSSRQQRRTQSLEQREHGDDFRGGGKDDVRSDHKRIERTPPALGSPVPVLPGLEDEQDQEDRDDSVAVAENDSCGTC
jgi:hypothetical protein